MKNRTLFLFTLLLAPLAAFAQTKVDKKTFSLTYPDGWMALPIGGSDSVAIMMDEEDGAMTWATGMSNIPAASAQIYVSTLTQLYTQGYTRTDSSVKTLGGKAFITTGWKSNEAEDSTARVRIYVYQQGDYLFVSWLVYDVSESDASVAEVESALASLVIKVSTAIRRLAWNPRADAAHPRIDVLGRTWTPAGAGRIPAMPFYLRR